MIEKIGRPAMLEQLAEEASELAQAALDQSGVRGAAHIGPQADGIQEVIAGGLVQNSRTELAGTGSPGGTAVIGERDQRIKLSLG